MNHATVMLHAYIEQVRRAMGIELSAATAVVQSLTTEILSHRVCPHGNAWLFTYIRDHPTAGQVVLEVAQGIMRHLGGHPDLQQRLGRIPPEDYVFKLTGAALCVHL